MQNKKYFKHHRKLCSILMVFVVFFSNSSNIEATFTPNVNVYSDGVYMVNLDTDIVVYKNNETKKYYPASTTKILTALITLEMVPNLDEFVTVSSLAMDEFYMNPDPNKQDAATAGFASGQTNLTYRDCLYALMIYSACEAGNILAYNITDGDIGAFPDLMNKKAQELGCVNSHFSNSHGLHEPENYSCAYDMYLISKYAYDTYPEFIEICSETYYTFPANAYNESDYTLPNRNKLLMNNSENNYYYEYAKGIKTGSFDYIYDKVTGEAAEGIANLVSVAAKDGYNYMLVTLGAPYHDLTDPTSFGSYSFKDHINLYKWAFSSLSYQTVLSKNEIVAQLKVEMGQDADLVQLKPLDDYSTILPSGLDQSTIQRIITPYDDPIYAPVKKDEFLGTIELRLADETLTEIVLVSANSVELSQVEYFMDKVKQVIDKPLFKVGVGVLAALVVTLIILGYVNKAKKSKRRHPNNKIRR